MLKKALSAILFTALFPFCSWGQWTVTTINPHGPGSLGEAISQANSGDTITFSQSLLTVTNMVISDSLDYLINKSIYIKGTEVNGHRVILDGNLTSRIFTIDIPRNAPSRNVTFEQIEIKRGWGHGPSFYTQRGGGIFIYKLDSLDLRSVRFTENDAQLRPAAISVYPDTSSHCVSAVFDSCHFESNSPNASGVIELTVNQSNVEMRNCTFTLNESTIAHINADEVDIRNCKFYDNGEHVGSNIVLSANCLHASGSIVNVQDCEFNRNTGAPLTVGSNYSNPQSILVSNCHFEDNYTGGTALRMRGMYNGNSFIDSCTFRNNNGGIRGGAIFIENWGHVRNSTMVGNSASLGGAVYLEVTSTSNPDFSITNCQIDSNHAQSRGGALYVENCKLDVTRSSINFNSCAGLGGAYYSDLRSYRDDYINFRESTIAYNSSACGGVGSHHEGSIRFINSTIFGNRAPISELIHHKDTDTILYRGSVILEQGPSSALFYLDPRADTTITTHFVSEGYNILEPGVTVTIPHSTDLLSLQNDSIRLDTTAILAGSTTYLLPLFRSPAINSGDLNDLSLPQNDSIRQGRRDRGAAESLRTENFIVETVSPCDSITFDGVWYDYTTTLTFRGTNQHGTDSVHLMTIDTIYQSYNVLQYVDTCVSFTWADSNTYFSDTTVSHLFTSIHGCDSLVTLNVHFRSLLDSIHWDGSVIQTFNPGASIEWFHCDNGSLVPVFNAPNADSLSPPWNGMYRARILDGGCSYFTHCIQVSGIGLSEEELADVLLYPNPTSNGMITIGQSGSGTVQLIISDLSGRKLLEASDFSLGESIQMPVHPGLYLVQISSTDQNFITKKVRVL
ncbi:MAG: T9SS type A sorting domain-containing protein [Flavobacteriia bacterium]|nr:T9SS type A sorting domain-containing protein [Flavobacteriia bacterium]